MLNVRTKKVETNHTKSGKKKVFIIRSLAICMKKRTFQCDTHSTQSLYET